MSFAVDADDSQDEGTRASRPRETDETIGR